jgi:hypothetical protein
MHALTVCLGCNVVVCCAVVCCGVLWCAVVCCGMLWCAALRLFEFVMRMLATGSNCLPAGGIGALSEQLASRLPADSIFTGECVCALCGVACARWGCGV